MFGFGNKPEENQIATLNARIADLSTEVSSWKSWADAAKSDLAEKELARQKAVDANHGLQQGWKDALAEVKRLTVCVDERDAIIGEHAERIATLTETVRLAELNQKAAKMDSETCRTIFERLDQSDRDKGEKINELNRRLSDLRQESELLMAKNERIGKSLRDTHLAMMAVIDEMECPEDDVELPVVEEYITKIREDVYQATKGRRVEESIRAAWNKSMETGRTIQFAHNWTMISISPSDTIYEVEQRFKERREINEKIGFPQLELQESDGEDTAETLHR